MSAPADTDGILRGIAAFCPTDFVVWDFAGDRLTLRGGRDASGWSDLAVVFDDVVYMALPVYLSSVTIRLAGEAARASLVDVCDCDPGNDDFLLFEVIEDDDWPEGRKAHRVAADAIRLTVPAPSGGDG